MLQIFHHRRKSTLGAAILALLLVVSAWPCSQGVEAEEEKTEAKHRPKIISLNDAPAFKDRTSIEAVKNSLGLMLAQDEEQFVKVDIWQNTDNPQRIDLNAIPTLSPEALEQMSTLLNDYRRLAGIKESNVKVVSTFDGWMSQKGRRTPQKFSFMHMYVGESFDPDPFGIQSEHSIELIKEANRFDQEEIDSITEENFANGVVLLMDASYPTDRSINLEENNPQKYIVDAIKNKNHSPSKLSSLINGYYKWNRTAQGPINYWFQDGQDYIQYIKKTNPTVFYPDMNFVSGRRNSLLKQGLSKLSIGVSVGEPFNNEVTDEHGGKKMVDFTHYNAACWNMSPPTEEDKLVFPTAFPAPGVFPSEYINPQRTHWSLQLDPTVYQLSQNSNDIRVQIIELNINSRVARKQLGGFAYGDDLDFRLDPPGSQTGIGMSLASITEDNFPTIYNLAPLDKMVYLVSLKGLQKDGQDVEIRYWVKYQSLRKQDETTQDNFKKIIGNLNKWSNGDFDVIDSNGDINVNKIYGTSDNQVTPPSTPNSTPDPVPDSKEDPSPTAQHKEEDTTGKGTQLPPPPKPGGSSSKYGNWNKSNKDGSNDEDDDESDTIFGSKYSRNRGPQSKQLRFQGPMAAPQGPGNQFPAGQLSGQPSPMPLAPQNMGQGVNPQGVNQMAMPQGVNQAAMPVAANNVLQQVPETGEVSFQPWVLGALLGAVALVLAKRRKF